MKWHPYSHKGGSQFLTWFLLFSSSLTVALLLGCAFEPEFDTPDATVQTYVWAHNHNNKDLMTECGYNADLYKVFRVRTDLGIGEPTYEIIHEIQAELLMKEWARPKTTRKYTSDRALLLYRFTSKADPTFDVQGKVLLVKRRNKFMDFSDPIRWQLMSLENARAEVADSRGTRFE